MQGAAKVRVAMTASKNKLKPKPRPGRAVFFFPTELTETQIAQHGHLSRGGFARVACDYAAAQIAAGRVRLAATRLEEVV